MNRCVLSPNLLNPVCGYTVTCRGVKSRKVKEYPEFGKTTYVYRNLPEPGGEFEENEFSPRRLSYWPTGLGQHKPRNRLKPWYRYQGTLDLLSVDKVIRPEYTETPQYPSIDDFQIQDVPSIEKRNRLAWYSKIRSLGSVAEKIKELHSHQGLSAVRLASWYRHSYDLGLYQNMTRTNIHEGLPDIYDTIKVDENLKQRLATSLINSAYLHHCNSIEVRFGRSKKQANENLNAQIKPEIMNDANKVHDTISSCLRDATSFNDQLLGHKIDDHPFISSFWYVGGLEYPSNKEVYSRFWQKSSNQPIQYNDSAVLSVRSSQPLSPILESNVDLPSIKEPTYEVSRRNPGRHGYNVKYTWQSYAAGYWPDEENYDFAYLSVLPLSKLKLRRFYDKGTQGRPFADIDDNVHGMGVMHSYAWLNALAMYHGFGPYDELTYPFTTQTIVTDGVTWYFYVYQLNTHSFHGDLLPLDGSINKYNNCWSSGPLYLYESISEDGTVNGFNDKVVDLLAKFLTRKTAPVDESITLKPYLGVDTRDPETIAKHDKFMKRRFVHLLSRYQRFHALEAQKDPGEYITGRNAFFPDTAHLRRHNKWLWFYKLDRNKFTV